MSASDAGIFVQDDDDDDLTSCCFSSLVDDSLIEGDES